MVDTIYRNPSRWRAVIHTQDVRHGTAGCLLSLVLLAPLFVRQYGMATVATACLAYSIVIVPAVTNYFSPLKLIMTIFRKTYSLISKARCKELLLNGGELISIFWQLVLLPFLSLKNVVQLLFNAVKIPFICFWIILYNVHEFYTTFEGFRVTTNQVAFFMICEKYFCPEARLSSLHFLLFFTVLAYLQRSLVTRQWSHSFYETNIRNFLKLTTWFIAVRMAKGVAMAFVLIIFTMQFNNIEPNLLFVGITFLYFVLTQKKWTGNENVVNWIRSARIDHLEEEEEFWVPFYSRVIPIAMSGLYIGLLMVTTHHEALCIVTIYTNVISPIILLKINYDEKNSTHFGNFMLFRRATTKELHENPICAVCLDAMRTARVTPCKHLYHATCLKKCLAVSHLCPLCKRALNVFQNN